ncbi:hypothetical protein LFZ1_13125 [Salmonella enterica subsp. enterica serovar Rubislaw str. SA20030553]|nr:hypothetical protein LFZ1_13125 [Salmonella enterica subsp. enterica serovar Rubislaw str. SA20030553]
MVTSSWGGRRYSKYGISYQEFQEFQEILAEHDVSADHSTLYRWVQCYAFVMKKQLRWYWRNTLRFCPWHPDETYISVYCRWSYLYP